MLERAIADSVSGKIMEAIERTDHLVSLVPVERLSWRPEMPDAQTAAIDLGRLLGHLLTCLAGFCAALCAAFPAGLSEMEKLRSLTVDHSCTPGETRERIALYSRHIAQGLARCSEEDLGRKIKTVFVPDGETLLTILLGNLEHLSNHKYQLFFYLKMLGVKVGTPDLYRLRGVN
jgi:DinB superfamily